MLCEKKHIVMEGSGRGTPGLELFDAGAGFHTCRQKAEVASDA